MKQAEPSEYLLRVINWARKLREQLQPILDVQGYKIHFRPSANGVALVGLLPERPQRGKSGFKNLGRLAEELDELFQKHCVDVDQGRATPEKRLQSWLISQAYIHGRHLKPLNDASQATADAVDLWFVSDEITVPVEGHRIACDLLAVRPDDRGGFIPVVIELKSDRQMKRLVEQVNGYATMVNKHRVLFSELVGALLGRDLRLTAAAEKWIVWPAAADDTEPQAAELAENGIRVVTYREDDGRFVLQAGERPRP